jgi:hypothetical protein
MEALSLFHRETASVPPVSEEEWMEVRARHLGKDLSKIK